MKHQILICHYCACEDSSVFVCAECAVSKCDECASRNEMYEATCIECLQNALFSGHHSVIQIISSSAPKFRRISYFSGADLSNVFSNALASLRGSNPSADSEIVIRISQKH